MTRCGSSTPRPPAKGLPGNPICLRGTVNGVEVTVNEAVYDGRTLYLMWTYRLPDVDVAAGPWPEERRAVYGTF